ncbi:MAG TPA: prepilin peptidase [Candidatus Paceibacterota bacterium]|jgi:leader peptidase (prepilin peptidase)/N-methyltransferase|nr:prepilin peptidase [Candidatus Paceibacterota bacterium]
MTALVFIFIFFLGTIIGSFLNVVIYRFNTGKTIVYGRSICMTCNRNLRWYELIPIFSFLIQSGRCRRCASNISNQYPLVEFGTGLIFALIAFHFLPFASFSMSSYLALVILFVFIFSLLMVISVYDVRHKVIPDDLVYIYAFVSFLSIFINHASVGPLFVTPSLMSIVSGPLFALPFALIWMLSRGRAMGLGDAKLMLGIGWMLGPLAALASVILSFWIGSVASLTMMLFSHKKMNMMTQIPFAPFLIIGALITLLFNLDIFKLSSLFHF